MVYRFRHLNGYGREDTQPMPVGKAIEYTLSGDDAANTVELLGRLVQALHDTQVLSDGVVLSVLGPDWEGVYLPTPRNPI